LAAVLTNTTASYTTAEASKLAAIDAGADQTDATNVAAAGAVMDADFAANGAMERTGAGTYTTILNKRDATAAPAVTDDTTEGYAVGSRWVDVTADKEYVCLDATEDAAVWTETTGGGSGGTVDRSINMFRVTLESGVPVSTTDQTAKTTIYACPAAGSATEEAQISLLGTDDTTWATHSTAQMSLGTTTTRNGTTTNGAATVTGLSTTVDLVVGQEVTGTGVGAGAVISSIDSATQVTLSADSTADGTVAVTFKCPASKNYDLFVVDITSTPTFVFGPVWTNDTTRATAITQLDGVSVLTGAFVVGGTTYAEGRLRHVGGVRMTTTEGQTEDSLANRFIASVDNQRQRRCERNSSAAHAYTTATARSWNASDLIGQWLSIAPQNALLNFLAIFKGDWDSYAGVSTANNTLTYYVMSGFGSTYASWPTVRIIPETLGLNKFYVVERGNANGYYSECRMTWLIWN
jgi:hypothetical protein